jgi:hypothetical protein
MTPLAGQANHAFKGIPRGAPFPNANPSWQEVSVRIVKYGNSAQIFWEDIIAGEIDVQARTIVRLTEGVVKAVDDQLWTELTQSLGQDTNIVIQSYAITGGRYWDASSAAIVSDLMNASRLISQNGNYDTNDLICFVSPSDKVNIMNYLADKGTQWQSIATDIASNGKIGQVAGITIIESNSVSTSYALVCKPKTCATYKELVSLRSTTIDDPYKSVTIRVVEEGAVELTDPQAIVLLQNLKAP